MLFSPPLSGHSSHEQSGTEIERQLVAGDSIRQLATKHDLHESALRRHRNTHLRKALQRALEKGVEEIDAARLIEWTHALHAKTLLILERLPMRSMTSRTHAG